MSSVLLLLRLLKDVVFGQRGKASSYLNDRKKGKKERRKNRNNNQ